MVRIKLNPYNLLLTTVLLAGCARVQIVPTPVQKVPGLSGPVALEPPLRSLPAGETLTYRVSWWGIPVGSVILSLTAPEKKDKGVQGLLKMSAQGRSNRYLDAFYPVRVTLTSFIDPNSRSPRRFQASVKRRWRIHESVITFDPEKGVAFHQLPKGRTVPVPVSLTTQDGLSALYYVRTLEIQVDQKVPLEISADGKNWPLAGRILNTSTVRLKTLGSWPAVEGDVKLAYPVPFFQGAKARIWFSADRKRIPLLAKIQSRIGPVSVVLTERSAVSSQAGSL